MVAESAVAMPTNPCATCELSLRVEKAIDEATITRHEMDYFAKQINGVVENHEKELRSVVAKLSELVLGFHNRLERHDQAFSQLLEQLSEAISATRIDKKRREKKVARRTGE